VKAIPLFVATFMLLAAGGAGAQMYRWVDKDGKVRYGDTPPPGVKTSSIKAPAAGPAPAASPAPDAKGAKDAKKGPLTPAEQEQAFRKRQADAAKAAEKAEADKAKAAQRTENCENAKQSLRQLESGQRIARTNAAGERYFLDDGQISQEAAKSRQVAQQACN
jgi:hypothetical protein